MKEKKFNFKNKWFHPNVEKVLPELLADVRQAPDILEIGCWEGYSSCKWIEHLKPANFYAVDGWRDQEAVSRFDHNTSLAKEKARCQTSIKKIKGPSQEALRKIENINFDFIYIDGSHTAFHILSDLINAIHLLKTGGIIAIDDYKWNLSESRSENFKGRHSLCIPYPGIKSFLDIFSPFVEVVYEGYQIWIKKKRNHLCSPEDNEPRNLIDWCGNIKNPKEWEKIPQSVWANK